MASITRAHRVDNWIAAKRAAVHRRRTLPRATRRVFIDCGANTCRVLRTFITTLPEFEFFAFEPQPELRHEGERAAREYSNVTFSPKAVWIKDEKLEFFLARHWGPNHRGASTVLRGHTHIGDVDYSMPVQVDAFDFSGWLGERFGPRDYLIVKMDIEGAEYPVLEKMLADDTLSLVDELIIEFHESMNDTISADRHRRLVAAVHRATRVRGWH